MEGEGTIMLHEIIQAAAQPIPDLHMFWPVVLLGGGMVGIQLYYLGKFRRAAQSEGDEDSSIKVTP